MKIDRFRMKGLTVYQQPIDLDLREVPAGLIAVVGPNGAGKSTLLEAMFATFYGEMPSRSDRELVDLVSGAKDAYLEATVSLDGLGVYRGRMNIDGLARKRDAVLERLESAGFAILNDGKVSTYDAAVAAVLPRKATVLASAFAAQNKQGSFSSLDRKGRKDLFAQLLGLEQLEAYAATARSAATAVDRRRDALLAQVEVLRPLTRDEDADALGDEGNQLHVRLGTLERDVEAANRAVRDGVEAVAAQAAEVARGEGARHKHNLLSLQRAELASALGHSETAEGLAAAAYVQERDAIRARAQKVRMAAEAQLSVLPSAAKLDAVLETALQEIDVQRQTRVSDLEARIANNQALLARADEIVAAVRKLEALERAVVEAGEEYAARVADAEARFVSLSEARRAAKATGHWAGQLERALEASELLKSLPFGERCVDAGCAFVRKAVEARAAVGGLEARVREAQHAANLEALAESDFEAANAATTAANQRHRGLGAELAALSRVREDHSRLAAATDRVDELRRDLASVLADADKATARAIEDRNRREAEVAVQVQAITASVAAGNATELEELAAIEVVASGHRASAERQRFDALRGIAVIDEALASLADGLADADAQAAELARREVALARFRAELANLEQAFARLSAEIESFERRRAEFRARQDERLAIEAQARSLEVDLIEWQTLARIFGRDGLPVLEIDAAGPVVSALANDLLQACFGGRFSVELVTQEAKAGGKGVKESFELKVWDAERGGEARDLQDLSGGEQVIVDEALKCALAGFINGRNVRPIRTVWRDEAAGALDPENAVRYMAMLRRLHERCGLHHVFFISHNPDASALADVQIVVEDGTARLLFPPFDRGARA